MIARRVLTIVLSIAALVGCREEKKERAVDHEKHAKGPQSTFAVQKIDDGVDPIPGNLPLREGSRIDDESAPFGVTGGMPRDTGVHYLRVAIPKGASIEAAYATGEQTLKKIDPGDRHAFAFGPIAGWAEDVTDPQAVAVRSFLLRGEPAVTEEDVVSATADLEQTPRVRVVLSSEGGDRMRALSRKSLGRRLAIVVDGRVVSAPAITHEVGKTIVFGVTSFDDAKRIADRIAP
ncbi:MAG: SecDF P1 head subdomain-containing protein [Polyangiales bacterium]